MRRFIFLLAFAGLVASGTGVVAAGDRSLPADLRAVRAAVARYHSVDQAVADGYVPASGCEQSPLGAMGIHYMNPSLLGPGLNPATPEVLLYLPTNGGLKLVGVEYFQVDADQNLNTDADRPSLFGQAFNGPMLGHNPQMPIHYDLHVWVSEYNPAGVFAQWNPAISCP